VISNKGNLKLFKIVASRRHTTQLWQIFVINLVSVVVDIQAVIGFTLGHGTEANPSPGGSKKGDSKRRGDSQTCCYSHWSRGCYTGFCIAKEELAVTNAT
jgi:hypothetical protein